MIEFTFGWVIPAAALAATLRGFRSEGVASLRWKMYTQLSLLVELDVRDQNGRRLVLSQVSERGDIWMTIGDISRVLDQGRREGRYYTGSIQFLTGYETTEYLIQDNVIHERII